MRTQKKKSTPISPNATPPCTKLKRIRERAEVTALQCAQAYSRHMGKDPKKASPTTWFRYESVKDMGDNPIHDQIIEAVMPLLVGRGRPKVTTDELLDISSAYRLLSVRDKVGGNGRHLPRPDGEPSLTGIATAHPLVVRYRAERGVYMDTKTLHSRTFGTAPIMAARDIEGDQFSVQMVEDGQSVLTFLQCVSPLEYKGALQGRRVVVVRERAGLGLSEVVLGLVGDGSGNKMSITGTDGKALTGQIYGVVIGSYTRE